MPTLPTGKLPAELLRRLLTRFSPTDPRVIVGPRVGVDAAVIDVGDRYLVAKTDPVTFATDEIGWYAVHVNANDVACCGAVPRWFMATLLLPERDTTEELVEQIFTQITDACRQLGVSLCGGHTEITHGLDRPIVVGQMLGEVAPDGLVTAAGARPGDVLLLTKSIAIEGTALLARELSTRLVKLLSADELQRCRDLLRLPGISVVREARLALEIGGVHALHDPTRGRAGDRVARGGRSIGSRADCRPRMVAHARRLRANLSPTRPRPTGVDRFGVARNCRRGRSRRLNPRALAKRGTCRHADRPSRAGRTRLHVA